MLWLLLRLQVIPTGVAVLQTSYQVRRGSSHIQTFRREQAQVVHLINNRICYDQQQNILLKCAYFVVTINDRMLTRPTTECVFVTFCCWSCQYSVVDRDNKIGAYKMDRVKRIWYLSPMRAAKVQASLRIWAVSPEPSLCAHTNSESRETFRQKARSLAPLYDWACTVKICNDGMLEDTNSLDGAQIFCCCL